VFIEVDAMCGRVCRSACGHALGDRLADLGGKASTSEVGKAIAAKLGA